jgi:hypothetical protein
MVGWIRGLAVVALVAAVCGCGGGDEESFFPTATRAETGELAVYTVDSAGFTISVPSAWQSLTSDEIDRDAIEQFAQDNPGMQSGTEEMFRPGSPIKLIAVAPDASDGFRTNLNVVVRDVSPGDTVDDLNRPAHIREFERQSAAFLEGPVDSGLVDLPAGKALRLSYHAEVEGPQGPLRLYQEQYELISNEQDYSLVFTSLADRQAEYEEIFTESARSFRLD